MGRRDYVNRRNTEEKKKKKKADPPLTTAGTRCKLRGKKEITLLHGASQ
jgi:hypothetical protein